MKIQDLGYSCIKGGKMSNIKRRKDPDFFFLMYFPTGSIILVKGMICVDTMYNLKNNILKNACNLGHSFVLVLFKKCAKRFVAKKIIEIKYNLNLLGELYPF